MIIITGSGRSGTSIVTKLFNLCGHDIDNVSNWVSEARAGLEHPEIVAVNKIMFEIISKNEYYGTDWIVPSDIKKIVDVIGPVLQYFSKRMKGKVIKDPLFSKTLPVWVAAGCNIERVIVCERNPWIASKSASETARGFSPVNKYNSNQIAVEFMARIEHMKFCEKEFKIPFHYIQYENLAVDFKKLFLSLYKADEKKLDKILLDNITMSKRQ